MALGDRFQLVLATGFGLGYAPIAPGTFGSLLGLPLAWLLFAFGGHAAVLGGAVVVAAIGVWVAGGAARQLGRDDPGEVVVDEVAGQLVTLSFLEPALWTYVAGFLLFRLLDIIKPPPARGLEALPGGSGIMADDLMAGLYANLVLQLAGRGLSILTGAA